MQMILLILGFYFAAWLVISRLLFQHWWKYDSLMGWRKCPNDQHWSYYRDREMTHHGSCCLGPTSLKNEKQRLPEHVVLAMLASLLWPLFIPIAVVIYKRPMPVSEMRGRIRELEKEVL